MRPTPANRFTTETFVNMEHRMSLRSTARPVKSLSLDRGKDEEEGVCGAELSCTSSTTDIDKHTTYNSNNNHNDNNNNNNNNNKPEQ